MYRTTGSGTASFRSELRIEGGKSESRKLLISVILSAVAPESCAATERFRRKWARSDVQYSVVVAFGS